MDAQNQGSGWVHGDVPTGRKNRAVPGLRLQEEREQLSTDSAQWLGQRRLEASQPRLRPQTQGSPQAGAESAALTGGRASRDPCEDTRGSGGTHGAQGAPGPHSRTSEQRRLCGKSPLHSVPMSPQTCGCI